MKTFKDYLLETNKVWHYRIKVAGQCDEAMAGRMESLLSKFHVTKFDKIKTTVIQDHPLDFPKIKNAEVHIYEAEFDYPVTQWEIRDYLTSHLGITKDAMVVKNPSESSEQYQEEPAEPREGALLNDSEYKESPNANFDDYYGDNYNTSFVKELNEILKLQRAARGEEIPTEGKATFNTDTPGNNNSPVSKTKK